MLESSDLYQMFTYMRMLKCRVGFFVVPFWNEHEDAATLHPNAGGYGFSESPVENPDAHLYVLGINLMKSARDGMERGSELLATILGSFEPTRTSSAV